MPSETRFCPCGNGTIVGDLKQEETKPHIDCEHCADLYIFNWYLLWDRMSGKYWYGWKLDLSP